MISILNKNVAQIFTRNSVFINFTKKILFSNYLKSIMENIQSEKNCNLAFNNFRIAEVNI